jgi:excisionase family DNA binding protein
MSARRAHSTAEAAEQIGCSERWLIEQLRANRFPGRKVGRHWRMTDRDIADALDLCGNEHRNAYSDVLPVVGLTPRSKQRLSKLARLEGGGGDAA